MTIPEAPPPTPLPYPRRVRRHSHPRRKSCVDPKSVRALRLLSVTVGYLFFGAAVFSALEYDTDIELRDEIATTRAKMQAKYNFTEEDFADLELSVVTSIPFAAGYQWQFAGAFYFCTVVVTTVGYGHSTPSTPQGRLFCMVFALVGIPLSLVMFQSVGERVNTFIKHCLLRLRDVFLRHRVPFFNEVKSKHLLFVSLSIGSLTIALGTAVFHHSEGWSLFNSLYYIVITFSTIGFGDLVPLQTNGRLQNDVGYVIFTLSFILCGLAVFSACVNLLILEFMAHNADIVTARTRIRRLLSLRRSNTPAKRRAATIAAGNGNYAVRLSSHYRHQARYSELLDGIAIQKNSKKLTQTADTHNRQFFADVYKFYIRRKRNFTVRRLPSLYIDHLVNTSPTDVYL
uniref:Two pore potassium channel protein sup-9 n=1 Tax=Panagrellus redivivus TaxID=6233 RepID=A0A7E4VKI9_PANRE